MCKHKGLLTSLNWSMPQWMYGQSLGEWSKDAEFILSSESEANRWRIFRCTGRQAELESTPTQTHRDKQETQGNGKTTETLGMKDNTAESKQNYRIFSHSPKTLKNIEFNQDFLFDFVE